MLTSHSRILLSSLPEARILESGDQEIVDIPARWPRSVCCSKPVEVSQSFILQSALALAMRCPSGENFTEDMGFLWPWRIRVGL